MNINKTLLPLHLKATTKHTEKKPNGTDPQLSNLRAGVTETKLKYLGTWGIEAEWLGGASRDTPQRA